MEKAELSKAGKEELALALFLWKEFKCQGKSDVEIFKMMFALAKYKGVEKELEEVNRRILWPIEVKIKE